MELQTPQDCGEWGEEVSLGKQALARTETAHHLTARTVSWCMSAGQSSGEININRAFCQIPSHPSSGLTGEANSLSKCYPITLSSKICGPWFLEPIFCDFKFNCLFTNLYLVFQMRLAWHAQCPSINPHGT